MQVVTINKKVQGGAPVVVGTRIPVSDIIYLNRKKGLSPKEIVTKHYIHISLYLINEVLKWYKQNKGRYDGLDI